MRMRFVYVSENKFGICVHFVVAFKIIIKRRFISHRVAVVDVPIN